MYEKSIEPLNKAVAEELSGVNKYMYFHFHCSDQGYDLLANLFRKTAIEEMIHVERLAERILFLKGDVEMQPSTKTEKIRDVADMLKHGMAMECASNSDSASRKLLEELVMDEERHFSVFETELSNLNKFGAQYLALQSIERSKTISTPTEKTRQIYKDIIFV